jgi:hypothetical protein
MWSKHSRRIDPMSRSAKPFCQGEAGAIGLSRMPMAAYVSRHGHAFIDRTLYLPKEWTDDPDRLAAAYVPPDAGFATKPKLATRMIARAIAAFIELDPKSGRPVARCPYLYTAVGRCRVAGTGAHSGGEPERGHWSTSLGAISVSLEGRSANSGLLLFTERFES